MRAYIGGFFFYVNGWLKGPRDGGFALLLPCTIRVLYGCAFSLLYCWLYLIITLLANSLVDLAVGFKTVSLINDGFGKFLMYNVSIHSATRSLLRKLIQATYSSKLLNLMQYILYLKMSRSKSLPFASEFIHVTYNKHRNSNGAFSFSPKQFSA